MSRSIGTEFKVLEGPGQVITGFYYSYFAKNFNFPSVSYHSVNSSNKSVYIYLFSQKILSTFFFVCMCV